MPGTCRRTDGTACSSITPSSASALGSVCWCLLIGWQLALVAAGVHAAYYLLGGGAINAVGHRWGRRPYDNKATNNQWLAWLVVGEGLHNNHHAAATSSRLSLG